jgi:hypothetical protein
MKKVLPFLACALLLGISCSKQSAELTDEQKTTIISEVGAQVDGFLSAAIQLNFEGWSEYWSEDKFISVSSDIEFFDARSIWINVVADAWLGVESRSIESSEKRITPLTLNLAHVSREIHGSAVLKNEEKIIFTYQATSIWKKEAVDWKIIQLHESIQQNPFEE